MRIFELDAIFEKLCSEFSFIFPKESWFDTESDKIRKFDLTMSYDDYANVKSQEELKIIHDKYEKLINHKIDNEFDPVIDGFIKQLREFQKELKKKSKKIIKYWA